uniref:G-protein coupled receptors family 1 profile domain-containing protein n=1 Tax=Mola mola TaxID=94237 RepID=A0A3Q4C0Z7_MOLML
LPRVTGLNFQERDVAIAYLSVFLLLHLQQQRIHYMGEKRFAFVCHLCAVDLLCAILLMPLGIISSSPFFGTVAFTVLECQVYIFLNVFLICLTILTVTAISVERYFYIVHPMRYEVKMTINLAIGVMLLIWVKSALLALVTLFGWPSYGHQSSIAAAHCSLHASHSRLRNMFAVLFSVVCFLVPVVVIFTVYCAVYKVARSAALQLAPAMPTWANANPVKNRSDSINSQTTMITTSHTLPQRLSPERAFRGGKAALTLVFIVGQFLLCWLCDCWSSVFRIIKSNEVTLAGLYLLNILFFSFFHFFSSLHSLSRNVLPFEMSNHRRQQEQRSPSESDVSIQGFYTQNCNVFGLN